MQVKTLSNRARNLPRKPGVYLFKDAREKVIYVGKAKDLRSRVSSYARATSTDAYDKQLQIAADSKDLDFIITTNEVEALILENTLIKKYKPRYNVMLRDDKSYPYIKLTNEPYPRLELTRRVTNDGASYFGPYSSAYGVRGTLAFLQKTFPLRLCKKMKKQACMYYHIGKCAGPCSGEVDDEEYARNVNAVSLFLKGRHHEITEQMKQEMKSAASEMQFERAAILRDRIAAIDSLFRQKQEVVWARALDMDVIGLAVSPGMACAEVMFIRGGMLVGHDPFMLRTGPSDTGPEILSVFIEQYYAHREEIPGEIVLDTAPENQALLQEFLALRRENAVSIKVPVGGKRRKLLTMAAENARQRLTDEIARDLAGREQAAALLSALQERLGANRPPARIVGFDISTIQGTSTVGSAVSFQDGLPDKSGYRKFIIKSGGRDDFSSMQEMTSRYLGRVQSGKWPPPDLIIVDGGKGQLSAVELGMVDAEYFEPVYVMGFAKKSLLSHVSGREEPIAFEQDEPALFMVRRVIAEAHRFAITFHRRKRTEKMLHE